MTSSSSHTSFLIGVLPTAAEIGIAASVLLVLVRIMQGISVAGEYTTSGVLLVEQAEPETRGFIGGWIAFAMMLGCVAGSGVPALLGAFLTEQQIQDWGWRIPSLVAAPIPLPLYLPWRSILTEERAHPHAAGLTCCWLTNTDQ